MKYPIKLVPKANVSQQVIQIAVPKVGDNSAPGSPNLARRKLLALPFMLATEPVLAKHGFRLYPNGVIPVDPNITLSLPIVPGPLILPPVAPPICDHRSEFTRYRHDVTPYYDQGNDVPKVAMTSDGLHLAVGVIQGAEIYGHVEVHEVNEDGTLTLVATLVAPSEANAFGFCVAISDDRTIVVTDFHSEPRFWVFTSTGDNTWDDGQALGMGLDRNAHKVAISREGNVIVASAQGLDYFQIWVKDSGAWILKQEVVLDAFKFIQGAWLSPDGKVIALNVGWDDEGFERTIAQTYRTEDFTIWTHIDTLVPAISVAGFRGGTHSFSHSAIGITPDLSTLVLGAPDDTADDFENRGVVYVFNGGVGSFTQTAAIIAQAGSFARMGRALMVSDDGNFIVTGAAYYDLTEDIYFLGAAYFIENASTITGEVSAEPHRIDNPYIEEPPPDYRGVSFGRSITMDRCGNTIAMLGGIPENYITDATEPFELLDELDGSGLIVDHTSDSGHQWLDAKVGEFFSDVDSSNLTGGRLHPKSPQWWFGAVIATELPSAEQYVEAIYNTIDDQLVLAVRWDEAGFGTGYRLAFWQNPSPKRFVAILHRDNGGGANDEAWVIGTGSGPIVNDTATVRLAANGATITITLDGVVIFSVVDPNPVMQVGSIAIRINGSIVNEAVTYFEKIIANSDGMSPIEFIPLDLYLA